MSEELGTVIVGAGVIGAGVAYALSRRGMSAYVVEADARAGTGISSRNSGVIHAGLYYPPGSLKERLCRLGSEKLYHFARTHGVDHLQTGKYIVANDQAEIDRLRWLEEKNEGQVPLHRVEALPAGIQAKQALYSPNSGIVDIHQLIEALLAASGVEVLYHQRVTQIKVVSEGVSLTIDGQPYVAEHVVNCAGLAATDFVADKRHYFGRGNYFAVKLPAKQTVPHLVYPAVPKESPSLGIHLTRNIAGEAYLGPDLEWVERESYGVNPDRADSFYKAARRYLPWLKPEDLSPGFSGIRPKLSRHDFHDFCLLENCGLIHCIGVESPGITASMAIGEYIADRLKVQG